MNTEFKKNQTSFLIQLVLITIAIYGIHSYLLFHFAKETTFFFPLWHIYVFLFIVTLVVYTIINYRLNSGKTDVFNVFMIATFLKMLLAIIFLLPLLVSEFENKQSDVFNFFIPYFIFLFIEVYGLTKFLQKK